MPEPDYTEQSILLPTPNSYPQYYPAFTLDFLWYITEENVAYRVLLNDISVVGMNFFDLLFSQQVRQMLGSDWQEHASKDIRYFIHTTAEYQKEDQVFHEAYVRTREHLARLPGFDEMFSSLPPLPVDHSGKPFRAGTLYIQYRLSEMYTLLLEFDSIAEFIRDDPPKHRVTLVPSNQEARAGFILMYLARLEPIPENVHDSLLQGYLWRLALLKTVEEGLTKGITDTKWEPVHAFKRIRNELDMEFSNLAADPLDEVIARSEAIIKRLDEEKILDKEVLTDWANRFDHNHEELAQEDPDEISLSQIQEKLKIPCAFWLLTPQGNILAANLVATWLWEETQLNSNSFFGANVFEIFSRSRARIPKGENDEFFRKKIPVLIRLVGAFGKKPYQSFLNYINNYSDLKEIFNKQEYIPDEEWESKRIWEYSLKLVPPKGTNVTDLLEFKVTIYRLHPTNEFFGVYEPHPRSPITQSIIKERYNQAIDVAKARMAEYVQYLAGQKEGIDLKVTSTERSPNIDSEVRGVVEERLKVRPRAQTQFVEPTDTWEAWLELLEHTKEEATKEDVRTSFPEEENTNVITAGEQKLEVKPEISDTKGTKIISERAMDLKENSDDWEAILKLLAITQEDEKEQSEKKVLQGPTNENLIWDEWEG